MNQRIHRKVVKRVLEKNRLAIGTGMPAPLTKLEQREYTKFQAYCDKMFIPIVEEVLAEERMHGA